MDLNSIIDKLSTYLQRNYDPNYTRMMAELYNMRNSNRADLMYPQIPMIGSDTRGQTIPEMMNNSPRWEDLYFQGQQGDNRLGYQLRHPDTPDGLNNLINELKKRNYDQMQQVLQKYGSF